MAITVYTAQAAYTSDRSSGLTSRTFSIPLHSLQTASGNDRKVIMTLMTMEQSGVTINDPTYDGKSSTRSLTSVDYTGWPYVNFRTWEFDDVALPVTAGSYEAKIVLGTGTGSLSVHFTVFEMSGVTQGVPAQEAAVNNWTNNVAPSYTGIGDLQLLLLSIKRSNAISDPNWSDGTKIVTSPGIGGGSSRTAATDGYDTDGTVGVTLDNSTDTRPQVLGVSYTAASAGGGGGAPPYHHRNLLLGVA